MLSAGQLVLAKTECCGCQNGKDSVCGSFLAWDKVQVSSVWTNSQCDDIGKDVCGLSQECRPLPILSEHNSVKVTPLLNKNQL